MISSHLLRWQGEWDTDRYPALALFYHHHLPQRTVGGWIHRYVTLLARVLLMVKFFSCRNLFF
jgi:hypothetical protein